MAAGEAARLRRELSMVVGRRGPCFPVELKQRVSRWLCEQRAAGVSVAVLSRELGLAMGTVLRWSNAPTCVSRSRTLVPVEVIADPVPARTVSVTSPAGFRIDGLSFAEAAALLRALG